MKKSFKLSLIVVASALAACGGGGGGGGSSESTPSGTATSPVSTSNSSTLQTSVPTPSYAVGSDQLAAFNYLNAARSQCGLGLLKQNDPLDKTAKNHAKYMINNPQDPFHVENPSHAGFTGINPSDRAKFAGYTNSNAVGENGSLWGIGVAGAPNPEIYLKDLFAKATRELMQAPYHAMGGILSSAVEIGSAMEYTISPDYIYAPMYFNFGFGANGIGQVQANDTLVRTYPCQDNEGSQTYFTGEWTGGEPIVSQERLSDVSKGLVGAPIIVFGQVGKTLKITSASLTQASNNLSIPILMIRTKENDPNQFLYRDNSTGYIFPDKELTPFESYRAKITGTTDGKSFTTEFTYKVGAKY